MHAFLLLTFLSGFWQLACAQSFLSSVIHLAHPNERIFWIMPRSALPSGQSVFGEPLRSAINLSLVEGRGSMIVNKISFTTRNNEDTLLWEVGLGIMNVGSLNFKSQQQLGDSLLLAFATIKDADVTNVEIVVKGRRKRKVGVRFGKEAILNHFHSRTTTFVSSQFYEQWFILFYLKTERNPDNLPVFQNFHKRLLLP
jgi:hypothetical protein